MARDFSTSGGATQTIPGTVKADRFLAGDGTVALPAFAYASDPDTGFYKNAANQLSATGGGSRAATFAAFSMDVNGTATYSGSISMGVGAQVLLDSGTGGAPGLAFVGDPDTGISRYGANSAGLSAGGNQYFAWNGGGASASSDLYIGRHLRFSEAGYSPDLSADQAAIFALDVSGVTTLRARAGAADVTVDIVAGT